jgi:TolA-binding protein
MKPAPAKKRESVTSILKRHEAKIKLLEKRIRELEHEIKRLDLDEVTELNDTMNKPYSDYP